MIHSTLHLTTRNGTRYLQQLGKHFGHKVPVTFTPSKGEVTLPFGTFEIASSETELSVTVHGKAGDLGWLERFIGDHLARFAFREKPSLKWHRAA